jgi:branched-chain amino acid transport system permease protein
MKRSYRIAITALAFLLMAAYPLVAGKFYTYMLIEIMIFATLAVSYYLLLGHTGLLSVGHAAYFGVGVYCTALFLIHFPGLPVLVSILLGTLCGLVAGLIIGALLLRLSKIYFTFATLAFSQMLWAIAWKARSVTGGDDGLSGWSSRQISIPVLGSFSLGNLTFLYYLVAVSAVVSIFACRLFTRTPLGNSLSSMKSNTQRVDFMGININAAKLMVFSFSAMIAALAGSLFVLFKKMASPDFIDMFLSFDVVVMNVIGGYTNFAGPIVGSVVYVFLVEFLSSYIERWQLVLGAFFVCLLLYYPGGVLGVFKQLSDRIGRRKRTDE